MWVALWPNGRSGHWQHGDGRSRSPGQSLQVLPPLSLPPKAYHRRQAARSILHQLEATTPTSANDPAMPPKDHREASPGGGDDKEPGQVALGESSTMRTGQRTVGLAPRPARDLAVRVASGVVMGLVATTWILAGTWVFTVGLTAVAVLGQLEYYNMVRAKGIRPAQRAGIAASVLALWVAAAAPLASEAVFPVSATLICTYMLLHRREKFATIADISTTFMGMFYAGYLPTFWVRMRSLGGIEQTRFPAVVSHLPGILWPSWLPPPEGWTVGAALTWWTWLSVASSDIGALFIGRAFGRHKLSDISPKKTVEGAIGGFLCAAIVSILGAFLLKWPVWWLTGTAYGMLIGVVGLLGDLTASLFKRDAGFKDSPAMAFGGRFRWALPGHGGILDRTDSFVFTAPLVYYFVTMVLPAVRVLVLGS